MCESMPDFSPISSKGKRLTMREVRAEFAPKSAPKAAPPPTVPSAKSGVRSKSFKPLLLKSKIKTDGFKMPKQRSKAPSVSAGGGSTNRRMTLSNGTVVNSSVFERTGRISSTVFLKRIQKSILALDNVGDESDEIELTKERKQALADLGQSQTTTLSKFITSLKLKIEKIGEGAFGEVFMGIKSKTKTIIKVFSNKPFFSLIIESFLIR